MNIAPNKAVDYRYICSTIDDRETLVCRVMDRLMRLSCPIVEHYMADHVRDVYALDKLLRHVPTEHGGEVAPFALRFFYSFNDCGTDLSVDPDWGRREHRFECWLVLYGEHAPTAGQTHSYTLSIRNITETGE